MPILILNINEKITKSSKEFASIFDVHKKYNICEIAKICLNIPNSLNANWGGAAEAFVYRFSKRFYKFTN